MSKLKNNLGSIWYHPEPSDVPCSPNQYLGWDFFASSCSKTALMVFICHAQTMPLYDLKWSILKVLPKFIQDQWNGRKNNFDEWMKQVKETLREQQHQKLP